MANQNKIIENPKWPQTMEEAVEMVLIDMPEENKEKIRETPKEKLSIYHFGLGTWIRNTFGLWSGNDKLLKLCGQEHPDDASGVIIEAVWEKLQQEYKKAGKKKIMTKSGREKPKKDKDIFLELQSVYEQQKELVGECSFVVAGHTWWSLPPKMGVLAKTLGFKKEKSANEWRFYNLLFNPILLAISPDSQDYLASGYAQTKALEIMQERYPNNFLLKNISPRTKLLSKKDIAKMLSEK